MGAICNWRQGRQDAHWQWANECGTVCQSGAALRRVDLSMLTSVPRAQHNPLVLKIHSFLPLQRQSCSSTLRCLTWATNLWFCVTVSLKTRLFFLFVIEIKNKKRLQESSHDVKSFAFLNHIWNFIILHVFLCFPSEPYKHFILQNRQIMHRCLCIIIMLTGSVIRTIARELISMEAEAKQRFGVHVCVEGGLLGAHMALGWA